MPIFKFVVAMGTTVEVFFDKEDKTYRAGDTVFGRIVVESDEEKNLRLIKGTRVRCKGFSTVDLKFGIASDESGASLASAPFVDDDAKVLTHKLTRSTYQKGSTEMIRCEYPFQFQLPTDLPSSFKSLYGKMEYLMKASVPSGVAVSYFEGRGQFNVVGILDLTKRPGLQKPMELRLNTPVKTLLSEEGNISFYIRLSKKGYAIGESIVLHQEIVNNTKHPVKASISLIQKITYEFSNLLRLDKENKMKAFGKDVAPGATDICEEETIEIPNVPVTSVIKLKDEKKIVKIDYFLKYEVVSKPKWIKKFKGYIPITIGSIPLKPKE